MSLRRNGRGPSGGGRALRNRIVSTKTVNNGPPRPRDDNTSHIPDRQRSTRSNLTCVETEMARTLANSPCRSSAVDVDAHTSNPQAFTSLCGPLGGHPPSRWHRCRKFSGIIRASASPRWFESALASFVLVLFFWQRRGTGTSCREPLATPKGFHGLVTIVKARGALVASN